MAKQFMGGGSNLSRKARGTLGVVLFANLLACTEYVPVRGAVDASSQPFVRVRLTDQGMIDVAPRIGLRAQTLEGVLQSVSDSSLAISVRQVSREGGIEDTYTGENLTLLRRDYEAVETGRTSVIRSVLLAGGIVAGALLIARGAGAFSGSDNGGKPPKTN